jgi:hypothetical protein
MAFDPNNLLHRHYCYKLRKLDPLEREALEELTDPQLEARLTAAWQRPYSLGRRLAHDHVILMAETQRRGLSQRSRV